MQSPMVPLNAPQGHGTGPGMVVVSMPEHPPDYAVWSIATFFYGNPCCLGLIALIFSMKSRDRKMLGDMTGATTFGSKARRLNIIAVALMVISIIICIVAIVATSVSSASSASAVYNSYQPYRYSNRYR